MAFDLGPDGAAKAMMNGLEQSIRSRLRERIMERIEPDVQAAIDGAIGAFKASMETWRDPRNMRDTIKLIIEDKRAHPTATADNEWQ